MRLAFGFIAPSIDSNASIYAWGAQYEHSDTMFPSNYGGAKNLLSHPEDFANSNPVSGDTNHGTRGFWSASSGRILRADRDELMQFYRRHNGTELPFWYKTPSGECVRAHFAGDVESNLLAPGIYDYSVDIEELRP